MSRRVGDFQFRCESCGDTPTPVNLAFSRGVCRNCKGDSWLFTVRYRPSALDAAANGTLAVISGAGLAGLAAIAGVTVHGDFDADEPDPNLAIVDCNGLSAVDVTQLCSPPAEIEKKIEPFLQKYQASEGDRTKAKMKSQGAVHCKQCNTFFVPGEGKPWSMIGYCCKSCCAESRGTTSYNRIESDVIAEAAGVAPLLKEFKKEQSMISVTCDCGCVYDLAFNYAGVYRKCPQCGSKNLVPMK